MPLETGTSRAAFSHNVATERRAGKSEDQALAIAYSKQRGDASTATEQRKWKVSGQYSDGKPLRFTVLAYDHAEAVRKAEAARGSGKVESVALFETTKEKESAARRAIAFHTKHGISRGDAAPQGDPFHERLDAALKMCDALHTRMDAVERDCAADRVDSAAGEARRKEMARQAATKYAGKSAADLREMYNKAVGAGKDAEARAIRAELEARDRGIYRG